MSLASVKKASSTFMEALADVSMNLMPYSTASCSPRSRDTWSQKWHFITDLIIALKTQTLYGRKSQLFITEDTQIVL